MTTTQQTFGPFTVIPTGNALGADVTGLDIKSLTDDICSFIRQAWLDHLVLRFRDQQLSDKDLITFSHRFGEPDTFPKAKFAGYAEIPDKPEIGVISNILDDDGQPIGTLGSNECLWHTDMAYIEQPPSASILYSIEIPPEGGETGFLNMYTALDSLSSELLTKIEGRLLKHENATLSDGTIREGMEDQVSDSDDVRDWNGPFHPIIRTHPETKRRALFLGRRVHAYIDGYSVEESEAILDELWNETTQPKHTWTQEWQVGDLIMWDNRCVMHRRGAFDENTRRLLYRTQLKGEQPAA